jgi:lipid-binding SYLF domain-containing protein
MKLLRSRGAIDRRDQKKGGGEKMRKTTLMLACVVLSCGLGASAATVSEQLVKSTNVVNEIMGAPDNGIPSDLLDKAVCVGIVPSELKFAIGVGGTYGRGVLVCRKGGTGSWGAPSFFTLGGGSFGFQLGGKATDVVFIVMSGRGAAKLVQDNVKIGGELSAAAGPVGRSEEGATDAQLHAEILSYSRSRGLFAGASLDGAVVKQDKDDNKKLYGRQVTAKEILFGGAISSPPTAAGLDRVLDKHSPRGGQPFEKGTMAH